LWPDLPPGLPVVAVGRAIQMGGCPHAVGNGVIRTRRVTAHNLTSEGVADVLFAAAHLKDMIEAMEKKYISGSGCTVGED
jgi:hypothetical protein